jgi:chemotaxis protein CheX
MKAELVNTFIKAFIIVSEMTLGERPTMTKTFKKTATSSLLDIAVVVGITGDIRGQVVINFSKETGMAIASKMMGGRPITELDNISNSALSEIGNMVMGTASTDLSQIGVTTDITPPNLIIGEHMSMTSKDKTLIVSLDTTLGKIMLEIAIED